MLHTGPFGVNTLIVPIDGPFVYIVDPAACSLCGDESAVTSYLLSNHLEPAAVILTHGHFDHVAGLPAICRRWNNIPVLIHRLDSAMIGPDSAHIQSIGLSQMGFSDFVPAVTNLPAASGYLDDGKILGPWTVIHTPGHTPGSVCLYNKDEKVLISGDTVFFHSYGRTDLYGGDEGALRKSLALLSEKIPGDTAVYPGHESYHFLFRENNW